MSDKNNFSFLSVVIPAFNEEDGLPYVLENLQENFPGSELIVVNDASRDETASRARKFKGVRVIDLPYNHGYGAALKHGISQSTGDIIAWFDADNEHKADDLKAMVEKMQDGKLGAVLGERKGSVSRSRGLGKLAIRLLATILGMGFVKDFNCGLRIFRREVILSVLHLLPTGYSASTTTTFLIPKLRIPYAFHPINLGERLGESKVRWLDGIRTLATVLRLASLVRPLQLFGFLALLFGVSGVLYSAITMMVVGQGLPALGVVLVLSGVVMLSIALFADQLSHLRIQLGSNRALLDVTANYEKSGQ